MKIKCDYCNTYINDTDDKCPNCGSANAHVVRTADHTPKTIEELKQWYKDHHLPAYETTRFFIGINYTKPKAFGIYEENGQFIVYKNKDDGTRAIRYQGSDEAYAVNELYLKLKSEILNQKARQGSSTRSSAPQPKTKQQKIKDALINTGLFGGIAAAVVFIYAIFLYKPLLYFCIIGIPFVLLIASAFLLSKEIINKHFGKVFNTYLVYALIVTIAMGSVAISKSGTKYYQYNDDVYCYYNYDYYQYDSYNNDYYPVSSLPVEIKSNPVDYEFDATNISWDSSYDITTSNYYSENLESSSSSSDSDYDWDSGSDWDSGGTDWGSDW